MVATPLGTVRYLEVVVLIKAALAPSLTMHMSHVQVRLRHGPLWWPCPIPPVLFVRPHPGHGLLVDVVAFGCMWSRRLCIPLRALWATNGHGLMGTSRVPTETARRKPLGNFSTQNLDMDQNVHQVELARDTPTQTNLHRGADPTKQAT